MTHPRAAQAAVLIVFALGGAGCKVQVDVAVQSPEPANPAPGTWVELEKVDGIQRRYIVHVPRRALETRNPAAVFMFHGTSGDGEEFYDISGWKEKAEAEGFIAVFPSSLTYCLKEDENRDGDFDDAGETKVTTKWAAGALGAPEVMPLCSPEEIAALPPEQQKLVDHGIADDVAFVDTMIDDLIRNHRVDPRRIYASGFSNGGGFVSRLVQERSDRFAAIHAAAGGPFLPPFLAARPDIRVIFTVGSRDANYTEALGVAELALGPELLNVPLIHDRVASFRTMKGLEDVFRYSRLLVSGKSVGQFIYDRGPCGGRLDVYVIDDLGHQYANGRNHPIVYANELWAVFRNESL